MTATLRLVDLFLDMIAAERGAAANTLDAYRRDLLAYAAGLAARGRGPLDASTQDVRAYLATLETAGYKPHLRGPEAVGHPPVASLPRRRDPAGRRSLADPRRAAAGPAPAQDPHRGRGRQAARRRGRGARRRDPLSRRAAATLPHARAAGAALRHRSPRVRARRAAPHRTARARPADPDQGQGRPRAPRRGRRCRPRGGVGLPRPTQGLVSGRG